MNHSNAGKVLLVALLTAHCSDGTVNHALNAGAGGSIASATTGLAGIPIGSDMGAGGASTATGSIGEGGSSGMPPEGTGGIAGSSVVSPDASVVGGPDGAVDSSPPIVDMRSGPFKMLI